MKKLLFSALTLLAYSGFGQSPVGKGGKQFNFGLGFGGGVPIYASLDFAVHEDVTVTPQLAANLDGFNWLGVACKGDYHFNTLLNIPQEWDFYAGAKVGFTADVNNDASKDYHDGLDLGIQVGGRWYWSDWGLNLEIGGGAGGFGRQIGLSKLL